MNHKAGFLLLIVSLLTISSALAQSGDSATPSDLPAKVAAARCAYTQQDRICEPAIAAPPDASGSSEGTLAQIPRRTPAPPMRGRQSTGYPGSYESGPWMGPADGRHALIGGIIGFAFGAAIGSKGGGVRGSLALGALAGGIGAAIGLTIPPLPSRYPHRYRWEEDDEMASRSKPESNRHTAASEPVSPPPATGNATPTQPTATAP